MGLLVNTYLKTLRKEKYIMRINSIMFVLGVFATFLTTIVFRNLNAAVLSILVLISVRSVIAEFFLSSELGISVTKDNIYETVLAILFVVIGWNLSLSTGFVLYLLAVILYLVVKRRELICSFNRAKNYMNT